MLLTPCSTVNHTKISVEKTHTTETVKNFAPKQNSLVLSAEERIEIENEFVIIPLPPAESTTEKTPCEKNLVELANEKHEEPASQVKTEIVSNANSKEEETKREEETLQTQTAGERILREKEEEKLNVQSPTPVEENGDKSPQAPRSPGDY